MKYLFVALGLLVVGCEKKEAAEESESTQTQEVVEEAPEAKPVQPKEEAKWVETPMVPEGQRRQVAIATEAQRQLATQLMQKLNAAIAEGGPSAGVEVCSTVAPEIATSVGEANGVKIGRTSAKLRNPKNTAPEWMVSVLEEEKNTRRFFSHPDGTLGVATPIPMAELCVQCHGPAEGISAEVKEALGAAYPEDEATGYKPGDTRGWFWIEVPAES